jgi:hypothetical protein
MSDKISVITFVVRTNINSRLACRNDIKSLLQKSGVKSNQARNK